MYIGNGFWTIMSSLVHEQKIALLHPPVDYLYFEEADHRFGQNVAIAVTKRSNGRLQACVRQPFSLFD